MPFTRSNKPPPTISSPVPLTRKNDTISTPTFQLPDLPPLSISLTAGTGIPPPEELPPHQASPPPRSRQSPAEPATNPLSLHPTTPDDLIPSPMAMPGAFPPTPSPRYEASPIAPLGRSQSQLDLLSRTTTATTADRTTTRDYLSSPTVRSGTPIPTPTSTLPSPGSPTSSRRPSSVRRFLSLRSLNLSYGTPKSSIDSPASPHERPDSPGNSSSTSSRAGLGLPGLKRKKSGSWFSGGTYGRRRSSMMGFEGLLGGKAEVESENRKPSEEVAGPMEVDERPKSPPPKLPELKLDSDLGGFGMEGIVRS